MTPSERFKVAGDAAEILEEMGFTAMARMSDGTVRLDYWAVIGRKGRAFRHVVDSDPVSARALAEVCAIELRARAPGPSGSAS